MRRFDRDAVRGYDRGGLAPQNASISSSDRPRVSGTAAITQMSPITQNAANSQKVYACPIACTNDKKNALTRNAAPQLTAVATATARPRISFG